MSDARMNAVTPFGLMAEKYNPVNGLKPAKSKAKKIAGTRVKERSRAFPKRAGLNVFDKPWNETVKNTKSTINDRYGPTFFQKR